jgi:predicted TIM-barrel fold metal-dependent hydrolase
MHVNYPIIDADGHVMETDVELREFLEGRYSQGPHFKTYSYFPSLDGWNRGFGVPGKVPETPAPKWLEFLDELGVHTTVLYPTAGLSLGLIQNPEWSCVIARAYNSWIAERFTKLSQRLKAVALLPVHEPVEAAKELDRAKKLGLVAGLLPAVTVLNKGYGIPISIRFTKPLKSSICPWRCMARRAAGWASISSTSFFTSIHWNIRLPS